MSITLPPIYRAFCFHIANLLLHLSKKGSQVDVFLGFALMGIPRQIKGISITLQLSTQTYLLMETSSTPNLTNLLLKNFDLSPKASSEKQRMDFIQKIFCIESFAKNKVSSANCKSDTCTFCSPTKYLEKRLHSFACLINPDRPSATIRNKSGAIGFPCHNPLCALNSSVGLPLSWIDIDADSTPTLIQTSHFWQKHNLLIM